MVKKTKPSNCGIFMLCISSGSKLYLLYLLRKNVPFRLYLYKNRGEREWKRQEKIPHLPFWVIACVRFGYNYVFILRQIIKKRNKNNTTSEHLYKKKRKRIFRKMSAIWRSRRKKNESIAHVFSIVSTWIHRYVAICSMRPAHTQIVWQT